MQNPTILIGLDGATHTILDPLMEQGVMPFLKKFAGEGVRAGLLSTVPPLTPPAWTSLVTGRSPGNHGVVDFFQKDDAAARHISFTTSNSVRCETIWSYVSRMGRRATSLNFPLMMPPPEINGNVVSGGWMTSRQLRFGCWPEGLYDSLKALPGFNPKDLAMDMSHEEKAIEGCSREEYEGWINAHIRREKQWFAVLQHLMEEDPCDLTAILFDGVDKLQHLCWRFLDPACISAQPSSWETDIRNLCLDYFRRLDGFLADIADRAGPDATVVLASDHGFGPQTEIFFVNEWLAQNGYLAWAEEKPTAEEQEARLGIGQLARHVYMLDWDNTTAYASTPSSNGIHIVRKDEKGGAGIPEHDYERFRDELVQALLGIRSPATGEQTVSRVWTREEAFAGPFMHNAPDLTLGLRDGGMISILASHEVIRPCPQPKGTHRPEGVMMAKGPGIRRGATIDRMSILDIAPLLLYALQLPVPEDFEGSVPASAFEPAAAAQRPVVTGERSQPVDASGPREDADQLYDKKAEEAIAARLRDLGYIE